MQTLIGSLVLRANLEFSYGFWGWTHDFYWIFLSTPWFNGCDRTHVLVPGCAPTWGPHPSANPILWYTPSPINWLEGQILYCIRLHSPLYFVIKKTYDVQPLNFKGLKQRRGDQADISCSHSLCPDLSSFHHVVFHDCYVSWWTVLRRVFWASQQLLKKTVWI